MTEGANGKGSPGTTKGTESEGPKRTLREWGKALLPYAGVVGALAVPVILISTCQLQRLDALREDVGRDTAKIHKDVEKVSKEVHSNATNIAVLKNQMETVVESVKKVDGKLDRLLELPTKERHRHIQKAGPVIQTIPVSTSPAGKE